MAAHNRSITACGAARSGSPIERLITSTPAALRSAIFFLASAKWYGGRFVIKLDNCTRLLLTGDDLRIIESSIMVLHPLGEWRSTIKALPTPLHRPRPYWKGNSFPEGTTAIKCYSIVSASYQ